MTRMIVRSMALLAAASLTGCIESETRIVVKKDGSGTILQEQYFSPQLTGMMEGVAGMGAAMGGQTNAPAKPSDPLAMFSDQIEKSMKEFGEGVTLKTKEAKTNAKGWKGYKLTFAYTDVRKLKISTKEGADAGGGPGEEAAKPKPTSKIEFTPGPKAVLKLIPPPKEPKAAAPADATPPGQPDADAMAGMMAPMMAGMRLMMVIEVDGKITKTNASKVEGNKVTMADVQMDKIASNPEAMKLMMKAKDDPESEKKLAAMKLEGVHVEDPEKTVEIEFQ